MGNGPSLNKETTSEVIRGEVNRLLETEIKNIFIEEIRQATIQLVEERRKAIREVVEEYKLVIKGLVEEEKTSARAGIEEKRRAIVKLVMVPSITQCETGDIGPKEEAGAEKGTCTSAKPILSREAQEVLAKVSEGGLPTMMTRNLERIASEHGIIVSDTMTPNELVRQLHDLA